MKKQKINPKKVSVGLIVYNEEKNIANVLKDILSQKQEGWILEEIIVYNDGSTDKTVEKIKEMIRNESVRLIADFERKGKTHRLSSLFNEFKGDILVMFDGDIRLADGNVVTHLVESFQNPQIMLVGGNSRPFAPKNFMQRAVYATFSVFYRSRISIREGNNIFGCTGSILAIKKELARKIKLPEIINEDAFIYLYCIKEGFKFVYQDSAVVYYRLPSNLRDYLKQAFRSNPQAVNLDLNKYFGSMVKGEFRRPPRFYLKSILQTLRKNPAEVIFIVFINIICRPFYKIISTKYKLSWFTASSTH